MKKIFVLITLLLIPYRVGEAASLTIVKDEFQINQSTVDDQDHATVSMDQYGTSMVVWHDYGSIDGDGTASVGALIDSFGNIITNNFLINDTIIGNQRVPDVDTDKNGAFAVTWSSGTAETGYDVYFKTISSSGAVILPETRVNEKTSEQKTEPDIAMYGNGDFIIVWDEVSQGQLNYYVRFFDAAGNSIVGPIKINEIPSDAPPNSESVYGLSDIDVNESGNAVVVWESIVGSDIIIRGRKLNPYTPAFAPEFVVDAPASGIVQRRPMLDFSEAGDLLVTWTEHPVGEIIGDIYVKKYSRSTATWGDKIRPHDDVSNNQHRSIAKLTEGGQFIVAWTTNNWFFNSDVYMRFYNTNGMPLSGERRVNSTKSSKQERPAIAWYEYPDHILMIVSWESYGQDGDGYGIFSKIYRIDTTP